MLFMNILRLGLAWCHTLLGAKKIIKAQVILCSFEMLEIMTTFQHLLLSSYNIWTWELPLFAGKRGHKKQLLLLLRSSPKNISYLSRYSDFWGINLGHGPKKSPKKSRAQWPKKFSLGPSLVYTGSNLCREVCHAFFALPLASKFRCCVRVGYGVEGQRRLQERAANSSFQGQIPTCIFCCNFLLQQCTTRSLLLRQLRELRRRSRGDDVAAKNLKVHTQWKVLLLVNDCSP